MVIIATALRARCRRRKILAASPIPPILVSGRKGTGLARVAPQGFQVAIVLNPGPDLGDPDACRSRQLMASPTPRTPEIDSHEI